MPIGIIAGAPVLRGLGEYSKQTFTQATATAFQAVNLFVQRVHLGVGTATGFARNRYSLATGAAEGQIVSFLTTGTCEAYLAFAGTATGMLVFTEADDYARLEYEDDKWRILANSGATLATST